MPHHEDDPVSFDDDAAADALRRKTVKQIVRLPRGGWMNT